MPWIFEPDDAELAYSEENKPELETSERRGGAGAHPTSAGAALELAWLDLKRQFGEVELPVNVEYSCTASRENPFSDHKAIVRIND